MPTSETTMSTKPATKRKPPAKQKLNLFTWVGTNKRGVKVKGELKAANQALIRVELRRQGITPLKVSRKLALFAPRKQKIKQ